VWKALKRRGVYMGLIIDPEGKRPLEKLGVDRREDYICYYSKVVVVYELNGFVWLIMCQGCTNAGSQDAVMTKFLRWLLIS
jgi:hypothetical protein